MSLNGVIIVDKPKDITSFGVVSFIKRELKIKKVGHMGTLDPMATGVLPIMLGKATKALDLITNHTKKYEAEIKFGLVTDTQDITGNVLRKNDKKVDYKTFINVAGKFIGEIEQVPPMYSAIKKNGVKLYELARKGETIDRDKRKIFINNIDIVNFDEKEQRATIVISCSRGTYIRTLCADIGESLECGAAMSSLRRLESNGYILDDCLSLDEIIKLNKSGDIESKIIPIESIFEDLEKVNITEKQSVRFQNGGELLLERLRNYFPWIDNSTIKVFQDNIFIGLGRVDISKGVMSVYKIFV